MSWSERLPGIWYGNASVPFWLQALVPVYRALRTLDRAPYALGLRQPQRLPVPVIVVGNITAGGTGKTPLVIALVEALRARGRKPGVISRGYGRKSDSLHVLDAASDPAHYGDEPVLIRGATGVPVAVGRDRVSAARLLLATSECDVLIADDGLQHYPLFRNVEICVIDGERRFGNGLLLPAGPLREPLQRLETVTLRVCNGGVAQDGEIPMRLTGDSAFAINDLSSHTPLREFAGQRVHAIAGIGNPVRFFAMLRDAGLFPIEHPFPDHYAFQASDLSFGDDLPVLMTQKDAVKCTAFARQNFWQVPVHAQLPDEIFDRIFALIKA